MAEDEVKLLPCPFCNAEPEDCPQDSERPHPTRKGEWCVYIWCDNCNARGPEKRDVQEAAFAWNTRAIEATRPTDEVVERPLSFAWTATEGYKHYPPYVNFNCNTLAVRGEEWFDGKHYQAGSRIAVELPSEAMNELLAAIAAMKDAARDGDWIKHLRDDVPEPPQPCSTCGAKHPFDNVFCSDGFHAPPAQGTSHD